METIEIRISNIDRRTYFKNQRPVQQVTGTGDL